MGTLCGQKLDQVVKQLESFAPAALAEKWDNVGLLIEPSKDVCFKTMQFKYTLIYIGSIYRNTLSEYC